MYGLAAAGPYCSRDMNPPRGAFDRSAAASRRPHKSHVQNETKTVFILKRECYEMCQFHFNRAKCTNVILNK